MGLMAEVDASLEQLAHRIIGQRHGILRFEPPRTREASAFRPEPPDGFYAKVRV